MQTGRMTRRIGLIAFNDIAALDLTGPAEVFATANASVPGAYDVLILAASAAPVVSEAGYRIVPTGTLSAAPKLDTIIVPGGAGQRVAHITQPIVTWLQVRRGTRRIASVCTGIYALAQSGLLDGRRATTHWRFAADVSRRFPKLR